jgi:hypothetical protein
MRNTNESAGIGGYQDKLRFYFATEFEPGIELPGRIDENPPLIVLRWQE